MVCRIDMEHFISHAIDYFTNEEISDWLFIVVSGGIPCGARAANRAMKCPILVPDSNMLCLYEEYEDKNIFKKAYADFLNDKDESGNGCKSVLYSSIIRPSMQGYCVVILSKASENFFIDVLCDVLKKEYCVEVIDLNQLFIKGHIGPISIDNDAIHDATVEIRREAVREMQRSKESTADGRLQLVEMWDTRMRKKKLKDLGVKLSGSENKDEIRQLLIDAWVDE